MISMKLGIFAVLIFQCLSDLMVLGQNVSNSSEAPLELVYDRNDARVIWINNKTSEIVDKMEYRRIYRNENGTVLPSNGTWQIITYDPRSPQWQKPHGICADYEIQLTSRDGKTYIHNIETPVPTLKSTSKIRLTRVYLDTSRNRVIAELAWGNDFDYWTGMGGVLVKNSPWIKLNTCQSLFKTVVSPPTMENSMGTLWTFDPEYARNNCSFLFGFNGTLQIMPTPFGPGQHMQTQFGPGSQQMPTQFGPGQQQTPTQFGPGPHMPVPTPFNPTGSQPTPNTGPQFIQPILTAQGIQMAVPIQQQPITVTPTPVADQNCSLINFSTFDTNDSLQLNTSCETVSGASSLCVPPQRQCNLDCSPISVQAYNMHDNGEYLKIDWQFSEQSKANIRRYQVRYAEANVTPWNTVYSEQTPIEITLESNQSHVEIKNFTTGSATNFTIQICANLMDFCNTSIQWDQERKYAVGYIPQSPESANLMDSGNSRRKAKNGASHFSAVNGVIFIFATFIRFVF